MLSFRLPSTARDTGSEWAVLGDAAPPVAGSFQPSIGGYRLLRRLGEGRRSSVWLARDGQGMQLAVKLAQQASFAYEFELATALAHPNIVRVVDHGRAGGVAYLAMELADGGALSAHLRAACDTGRALDWLRGAASALARLHGAGLVHRDVKPANFLVRADGTLALSDFGLVVPRGCSEPLAGQGAIVGTPRYLAPEQGQGEPAQPAADVYSLGVLFHEMLCGQPPFSGETLMEVLSQHLVAAVPPLPAALAPLQPLAAAMLAKQPEHRPADAAAVLQAIDALEGAFFPRPAPAGPSGKRWLP